MPLRTPAPPETARPIGMNGRLFPGIWRPALDEVAFAARAGFRAIQLVADGDGLREERLGARAADVRAALDDAGIEATLEIVLRVGPEGRDAHGRGPVEALEANLPLLDALGARRFHWHLAPDRAAFRLPDAELRRLEEGAVPALREGVRIAAAAGLRAGLEPNEPALRLLAGPAAVGRAMDAVDGLGLCWDVNHAPESDYPAFEALLPRLVALHVADTPLPDVNHHLPLGRGSVDWARVAAMLRLAPPDVPAILEVGGLPKSGGYGLDTDAALLESEAVLRGALSPAPAREG